MYTRGPQWGENYDTTLDGFNPFKAIGSVVKGVVKVATGALGLGAGGTNELKINLDTGQPKLAITPKNQTPVEQAQQAIASVPTGVWIAGGLALVGLTIAMTAGRRR